MHLTEAERFLVYRRRRGFNQDKAAKQAGVRSHIVVKWENGTLAIPKSKRPKLGALKPYEKCFVLRRRKGISQEKLGAMIGRCRAWVALMETGQEPYGELAKFWKV